MSMLISLLVISPVDESEEKWYASRRMLCGETVASFVQSLSLIFEIPISSISTEMGDILIRLVCLRAIIYPPYLPAE